MLDPVLPLFLADVGFSPVLIGASLAAFSLTSFLLRPGIGWGIDGWSARGVHVLGR